MSTLTMRLLPILFTGIGLVMTCCGHSRDAESSSRKQKILNLDLRTDSSLVYEVASSDAGAVVRLETNPVGRYDEVFNDSNYVHWNEASAIGIKPLGNLRSHWVEGRGIVKIATCGDFYLEKLTFSAPFLVAEAATTLHEIGRRFADTVRARGGGEYRIRVTSVLRTPVNVRRLRRRNRNAVDSSVHQLGTTFDISYNVFAALPGTTPHTSADLKCVLAEVLAAVRDEGKCLVKYEKKQPCFHVSAVRRGPLKGK